MSLSAVSKSLKHVLQSSSSGSQSKTLKPLIAPTLRFYISPSPSHKASTATTYISYLPNSFRLFTTATITTSASSTMPVLTVDTINPHVLEAQYAVRGLIPQRAETYRAQLAKGEGKDLPFDNIIFANIGNPQQLDQKPITFFRQVASLLEYPQLLEQEEVLIEKLGYKKDAVERARRLLKEVKSVGAYSNSAGAPGIKESVAAFIERK
jgi:hypothetical protein